MSIINQAYWLERLLEVYYPSKNKALNTNRSRFVIPDLENVPSLLGMRHLTKVKTLHIKN